MIPWSSFNRYGFAVSSISCDGAAENRRLAKLLCTVAARELISADLLKDAAWAAVRAAGATQRSGSELETAEAEVEEAGQGDCGCPRRRPHRLEGGRPGHHRGG